MSGSKLTGELFYGDAPSYGDDRDCHAMLTQQSAPFFSSRCEHGVVEPADYALLACCDVPIGHLTAQSGITGGLDFSHPVIVAQLSCDAEADRIATKEGAIQIEGYELDLAHTQVVTMLCYAG